MENTLPDKSEEVKKDKIALPYDTSVDIFNRLLRELARVGSKGISINELSPSLKVSKVIASRNLSLARFLKFVDTDYRKAWLTEKGMMYINSQEAGQRQIVSSSLPKPYITVIKWINDNNGAMSIREIKVSIVRYMGIKPSARLLDAIVTSFANICDYSGSIRYIKGKNSRCEITDSGRELLSRPEEDLQVTEFSNQISNDATKKPTIQNKPQISSINVEKEFPITILTKLGSYEHNITHDIDWNVIDSIIASLKVKWEQSKVKVKSVSDSSIVIEKPNNLGEIASDKKG